MKNHSNKWPLFFEIELQKLQIHAGRFQRLKPENLIFTDPLDRNSTGILPIEDAVRFTGQPLAIVRGWWYGSRIDESAWRLVQLAAVGLLPLDKRHPWRHFRLRLKDGVLLTPSGLCVRPADVEPMQFQHDHYQRLLREVRELQAAWRLAREQMEMH